MKIYYVYILECADKSFYTGFTSNLDKRLYEHNVGCDEDAYTYKKRPVVLKWFEQFTDPNQAILIEKQIKGWSRKKKLALIEEDWEKLVTYSRNKYKREKNERRNNIEYHCHACLPAGRLSPSARARGLVEAPLFSFCFFT